VTPGRRALGVAFIAMLTLCVPELARATPFADVSPESWPYQALRTLAVEGVIQGYPDGAFKGDRRPSRDEVAAIIARVVAKLDDAAAQTASKADLDTLQTSTGVLADDLDALGVRVTALEDQLGTRAERTAFAPSRSGDGALPVSGTSRPSPATPTILELAAEGVIDGYPGGAFAGDRPLTRYEMAAIIARIVAKIDDAAAQTASNADLTTLQRLTGVLADELDALGVRVNALEDHRTAHATATAVARSLHVHGPVPVAGDGLIDGAPGRAFMRGRPLTRYEMAAITARVVARIDAEAAQMATKADLDTIQKSTGVLADELDALGVRVTVLESRENEQASLHF